MPRCCLARFALLPLAALLLSSCAMMPRKPKGPTPSRQAMRVGTVAMVNSDLHFVLVDAPGLVTPREGQALKTFAAGKPSGVLSVTAERKRPFIAADIVQGSPKPGDEVYQ